MANKGTHNDAGESVHWGTPSKVVDTVRAFFGGEIDLDPCSNDGSVVKATVEYKLPETDGLVAPWNIKGRGTRVYINSPFGRCFLRDDLKVVFSQKEWTAGRKGWKSLVETCRGAGAVAQDLGGEPNDVGEVLISDVYAARFKSTTIADWTFKCLATAEQDGCENIQLLPAATDTGHWQKIIFPGAAARCFIRGRLQFLGNVKGPAPMATALVYYGHRASRFKEFFEVLGSVR
jgi:hypothetical protein